MPACHSLSLSHVRTSRVVAINAPVRSASFNTASPAPAHCAPRPTTITGFLLDATMSAACSSAFESGCTAPRVNIADDGLYSSSASSKVFCWMSIGQESMIGRLSSFAR
jgi:hypothetical protein